ncbi:hypothetical protein [Paracoccus spongiarum]|uniref:Uncharacterized protein n=1 Tax=Paracoccus spongiarum TaxID=3064387 RepID=A0ABT9JD58_9RHOB|nr:hypothetical protein [Paracoccus sp. 2205BS29-5]MDP5307743.1 hypothetical protein [Paracoccus sp. 2205BS29-5]
MEVVIRGQVSRPGINGLDHVDLQRLCGGETGRVARPLCGYVEIKNQSRFTG